MGSFIDLHVHSIVSDGSYYPQELVYLALEKGLKYIALTDNDSVEGIPYAQEAAKGTPLTVIPGVEIAAVYNGHEIHVLGLFIDHENSFLKTTLASIASMRYDRNSKICELLQKEGFDISMPKLFAHYNSRNMTRATISSYLINKGYADSAKEIFEKYLGPDGSCYIPKFRLSLEDTAKLLHFAGGVSAIAHPVLYDMTDDEYIDLFTHAKRLGIGGIEAIHSYNTFEDELKFRDMAFELRMFITGGSDFYGDLRPDIDLGTGCGNLMIPESLLRQLPIR